MSTVSRVGQGSLDVGPGTLDTGGSAAGVAGITSVAVVLVALITMFGGADAQRFLLTFSIASILYATMIYSPIVGIPMSFIYLATFALAKRYLIPVLGYTQYDPLILVQPVVIGVFFMNLILRRRIPFDTRLSKMAGVLLVIMFLEMLNPLQGGLSVSLAGGLFYIVPFVWFYAGRLLGTPRIANALLGTIIGVAIFGVAYGLWQQFVGFSDVEKKWLELTRNDGGQYLSDTVMRVFSFFASFSDYVSIVTLASIVCWSFFLKRNKFAILPWIFLFFGVVMSSGRGYLLLSLFGASLTWAVQGKKMISWVPRLAVSAMLGVFLLVAGLNQVKQADIQNDTADTLLQWQAKGILKATDAGQSTGSLHTNLILTGLLRGVTNPLGAGLGTTTIASMKFAGDFALGTEFDISNMSSSCGIIGGVLYMCMVGYSLMLSVKYWNNQRSAVSLAIFGILCSSVGTWLIGARYANCMFIWFFIGYLDKVEFDFNNLTKRNKLLAAQATEIPAASPLAVPSQNTSVKEGAQE